MVGVAVIGCGRWGYNHVRTLLSIERCHLRWVCDQSQEALARVQSELGFGDTCQQLGLVLQDPTVEAVVIAAPAEQHAPLGIRCLEAGKHVLVEKPLTTTLSDAQALVDQAAKAKRLLHVGHICVHQGGVKRVRQLIEAQRLGKLLELDSQRSSSPPAQIDVDVIWDLAVHDISICNSWMAGSASRVSAFGLTDAKSGRVHSAHLCLHYRPDVLAHIHVSWNGPVKYRSARAVGEGGMAIFDDLNQRQPVVFDDGTGATPVDDIETTPPLTAELEDFLTAIDRGHRSVTCGDTGLQVVKTLVAAQRSVAMGGAAVEI